MELLTVREVAAQLKVSPRQIWKMNSSGKLPAPIRICRSVRWDAASIFAWAQLGCPDRATFEARSEAGAAR